MKRWTAFDHLSQLHKPFERLWQWRSILLLNRPRPSHGWTMVRRTLCSLISRYNRPKLSNDAGYEVGTVLFVPSSDIFPEDIEGEWSPRTKAPVLESRICFINESDFNDFNEIPANIDPNIAKSLRRFKTDEKWEASTNADADVVNSSAGWPNSSLHGANLTCRIQFWSPRPTR
jgi:hypothetical protein